MKGLFFVVFTCIVALCAGSAIPLPSLYDADSGLESSEEFSNKDFSLDVHPSGLYPIIFFYPSDSEEFNEYDDEEVDDEDSSDETLTRNKRQARDMAMGLALSHRDRKGKDRPVGKIHGRVDLNAIGNDRRNYHAHGGVGVGSVLWRSKNNRHSIGVGAYAERHRGRFQGFRYKSKPNYGAGIGYRFRF